VADGQSHAFESTVPFGAANVVTLCVSCSDGRFVLQTDEFMARFISQPACDRLAVPGGAACLAGHVPVWREGEVVGESVRFLQRAHDLKTVILVAHEDCGFYAKTLGIGAENMERFQIEDLHKAADRIRGSAPVEVKAFYARRAGGKVRFEAVVV